MAIHRDRATVTLHSGAPLPVSTPSGHATVPPGHPVTIVDAWRHREPCGHRPAAVRRRQRVEHRARSAGARRRRWVERNRLAAGHAAGDPDRAGRPLPARCRASPSAGARRGRRCSSPTSTRSRVPSRRCARVTTRCRCGPAAAGHTVARVRTDSARLTDTITFPAVRARAVRLRLTGGTGARTVKTKTDAVDADPADGPGADRSLTADCDSGWACAWCLRCGSRPNAGKVTDLQGRESSRVRVCGRTWTDGCAVERADG